MREEVLIRIAHSPDPDDAFMFYALSHGKIESGHMRFSHVLADIETLNRRAFAGEYELTALSLHAYAFVSDKYLLLKSGGSFGDRYGPIVVSTKELDVTNLGNALVAVPGTLTTSFLVLKLLNPNIKWVVAPFDRILESVKQGAAEAGLIIHEGQLTYQSLGLKKVVDLGEWWHKTTGLPLPLGVNGIRRDLGQDTIRLVVSLFNRSVRYALDHREEALSYALQFGRGLDLRSADAFVQMYVNERTVDCGPAGEEAIRTLLRLAYERGIIPTSVTPTFAV